MVILQGDTVAVKLADSEYGTLASVPCEAIMMIAKETT